MSVSSTLTHRNNTAGKSSTTHRSVGKQTPFFNPKRSFFRPRYSGVQPKLTVNAPDDIYEKEADAVADQVMRMPDPKIQRQEEVEEEEEEVMVKPQSPAVQRKCAACEKEEKLQRKPLEGNITPFFQRKEAYGKEISQQTAASLHSTKGSGHALPDDTRSWMENRFGADFSHVKVHTDSNAVQLSRELNAQAFTHGRDIYFNRGKFAPGTNEGKRLLAHELTHVVQQTNTTVLPPIRNKLTNNQPGDKYEHEANWIAKQIFANQMPPPANDSERPIKFSSANTVQRDLALASPPGVADQPDLTDEQIQEATGFNRRRYSESSIRQIQDVVGAEVTGILDADTIRMIAQLQEEFGLEKDGKVGANTFDLINRELTAEGAGTDTCLTSFRVTGPRIPMDLRALPGGRANIFTRFDVDIRFSPRCNCGDFEYRQFICGDVTRTTGGVTTSENHVFTNLPAGSLLSCPDWREDGDTSVPIRYGHRSAAGRPENRYLDDDGNVDQQNGCAFESFDVPGIWGLTAVSGSQYDFDIRFFGDVRRKAVGRVERKFWAVRDTINIP